MFTAAKDALTSSTARKFINGKIERYGEVQNLQIDSKRKTVTIVCDLIGETEPIQVTVGKYVIEGSGGTDYVRATGITASRPWISKLLEDFVEGRRFEVPSWARAAL